MASEIRVNQIQNRSGLSTVTFSDSGVIISGITTISDLRTSGTSVVAAGSTSAPSISPTGDSNTGIFFPSPDTVAIAEGGSEAARFDSSGRLGLNSNLSGAAAYNRLVVNSPDASCWISLQSANTGSTINSDGIDIGLNGSNQGHFWLRENADLLIATNNTERLRIDSSGRVTMPDQPAFMVRGDENTTKAASSKFSFTSSTTGSTKVCFDRLGNWSDANDRFTAPVTGVYNFSFGIYRQSATTQYSSIAPRVNGSEISVGDTFIIFQSRTPSDDTMHIGSFLLNLTVNDYVELFMRDGASTITIYAGHTFFGGYLVG